MFFEFLFRKILLFCWCTFDIIDVKTCDHDFSETGVYTLNNSIISVGKLSINFTTLSSSLVSSKISVLSFFCHSAFNFWNMSINASSYASWIQKHSRNYGVEEKNLWILLEMLIFCFSRIWLQNLRLASQLQCSI